MQRRQVPAPGEKNLTCASLPLEGLARAVGVDEWAGIGKDVSGDESVPTAESIKEEAVITHIDDTGRIKSLVSAKQRNEHELAEALLQAYSARPLIGKIKEMAVAAVTEIEKLRTTDHTAAGIIKQVLGKEWKHYHISNYGKKSWFIIRDDVMKRNAALLDDARHCSDIVRLYGEIVEGLGGLMSGVVPIYGGYHKALRQKDAYRKDWKHADSRADGKDKSLIWNAKRGGGRLRSRDGRPAADDEGFAQEILKLKGGISITTVCEDSTVKKIDRMFGLLVGCDISGTTTDTMYFIGKFGGADVDPIYHLLPIATIVAGGHHSLLEVALSLAINRLSLSGNEVPGYVYSGYSVGLFSTLMPTTPHAGATAVASTLASFENHQRNRLLLIYYKNQNVEGAYEFDKHGRDKQVWGLLASADDNMLQAYRNASSWPSHEDVKKRMSLYGITV